MSAEEMVAGNLYKITYLQQVGNGRWVRKQATAVYLDRNEPKDELIFSLRPYAGTMTLSIRHNSLEQIELVEENIPHKYRNGVRDEAVPVKRPRSLGYVPKPQ